MQPFIRGAQAGEEKCAQPEPFRGAVYKECGGQPVKPVTRRKRPVEPVMNGGDFERPRKAGKRPAQDKYQHPPFPYVDSRVARRFLIDPMARISKPHIVL